MYKLLHMKLSFIFQAYSDETIPDLIEEFNPIIQVKVSGVGYLIGTTGRSIGKTLSRNIIKSYDVSDNLKSKIDSINRQIESSLARAKDLGQNIEECVSAAFSGVSSVNLDFWNCRGSHELTEIEKLNDQFAYLGRQLKTLIPKCTTGSSKDSATIRTCLSDGLKTFDASVDSLKSSVRMLVDAAISSAENCMETIRSDADTAISDITNSLNNCVNNLLNG